MLCSNIQMLDCHYVLVKCSISAEVTTDVTPTPDEYQKFIAAITNGSLSAEVLASSRPQPLSRFNSKEESAFKYCLKS